MWEGSTQAVCRPLLHEPLLTLHSRHAGKVIIKHGSVGRFSCDFRYVIHECVCGNKMTQLQYNSIQYSTIRYFIIHYNTIHDNIIMQSNTIQHYKIENNTAQHNTIQYNTSQYNTIQYNATQQNTTQHNTTHYTALDNTTQHNSIHRVRNLLASLSASFPFMTVFFIIASAHASLVGPGL